MIRLLGVLLRSVTAVFRPRRQLVLENLALRQQLSVFRATSRRSALADLDRAFWTLLRRRWSDWKRELVIVLSEAHLCRILGAYIGYYQGSRTHLSLDKDAPDPREAQPPTMGEVIELPEVGGLHHRYERRAA